MCVRGGVNRSQPTRGCAPSCGVCAFAPAKTGEARIPPQPKLGLEQLSAPAQTCIETSMGHMSLLPLVCEPPKKKVESNRKAGTKRAAPASSSNDRPVEVDSDDSLPTADFTSSASSSDHTTSEQRHNRASPSPSNASLGGSSMSSFSGGGGRKDAEHRAKFRRRGSFALGEGSSNVESTG